MAKKAKDLKWHKLDNTAKIYPVIAGNNLSGVYRVSVTLKEAIQPQLLSETLEYILPWFEGFQVRLRRGVFWYYFETNKKKPRVEEEYIYPCRYIDPYSNNQFLFRVTYFKRRINLEVFHALTDGYGAINFMKELTCQYLRKAHPDKFPEKAGRHKDTSFNMEDSYIKYYRKANAPGYGSIPAYQLKRELLPPAMVRVIHGYLKIEDLKRVCKKYGVSITQYLTAVLVWSIYKEYLHGQASGKPIRINVPVNLRQIFPSTTTRNFFAVIFAGILPGEELEFTDILVKVSEDFKEGLKKEHLADLISYNVSNEDHWYVRMVPLFIKNIGVKLIYWHSSKGFTATLSNCGPIKLEPQYEEYVENFHMIMGVSKKQPVKCVVCSYQENLIFTFSSVFADTGLERVFFRKLSKDGISVKVESNGVS